AEHFELEKMGYPVVSHRAGRFYVVDGQHRLEALRSYGFDDADRIDCEVYEGLTEREECELFLGRNRSRAVDSLSRFAVCVRAGRPVETTVNNTVVHLGLKIGKRGRGPTREAISAVSTLLDVHQRVGPTGLAGTLRIVRDAYGMAGCEAPVLDGVGLV